MNMWKKAFLALVAISAYTMEGICADSSADDRPPMSDKEKEDEARRLFGQGSVAMDEGKFVEACAYLNAALELLPQHLNTAIKLAQCYERAGALATALEQYSYAKTLAEVQKKTKWFIFLTEAIDSISTRVSWLIVIVPERVVNIQGLTIIRDGTPIARADWWTRIPIDPGQHTFWTVAPGYKQWRKDLRIAEAGKAYPVTIESLEPDPPKVKKPTP